MRRGGLLTAGESGGKGVDAVEDDAACCSRSRISPYSSSATLESLLLLFLISQSLGIGVDFIPAMKKGA